MHIFPHHYHDCDILLIVDSCSLRSELSTYFITMNSLFQFYYYSISDILAFEWRNKHMFPFSFPLSHSWLSGGFASFVDCKSQNDKTNKTKLNARTFCSQVENGKRRNNTTTTKLTEQKTKWKEGREKKRHRWNENDNNEFDRMVEDTQYTY